MTGDEVERTIAELIPRRAENAARVLSSLSRMVTEASPHFRDHALRLLQGQAPLREALSTLLALLDENAS